MSVKISDILAAVAYVSIFSLTINGCVHSCNKHKDDPQWLSNTPLAIYRGAEYFWHDDFGDVDWRERIENDGATILDYMNMVNVGKRVDEIKMEIEEFSKRIRTYPSSKQDTLKRIAKLYIDYSQLAVSELSNYCDSVYNGVDIPPSNWSTTAKKYADSLSYYHIPPSLTGLKELDSVAIVIRLKAGFGEMSDVKKGAETLKNRLPSLTAELHDTYYRLFRQRL
jgi:hypothetical protein